VAGLVRTHQFGIVELATAGLPYELYEVPPGHRAVVKWASIISFASTPGSSYVYGGLIGGSAFQFLIAGVATSGVLKSFQGYAVLEAGESVIANVDSVTGGSAFVGAGGVLFEL